MILIIPTSKEELHNLEFVKPVEEILSEYITKTIHYLNLKEKDLNESERIIICGTSLKDNRFREDCKKFNWINSLNKPILGICAGMQIIGLVNEGTLKDETEIGYFHENFIKEFLGLEGDHEVYHLHNNYINFNNLKDFEVYAGSKIPQAIKHKTKEIYGTLFHPEVRQKELIKNFARL